MSRTDDDLWTWARAVMEAARAGHVPLTAEGTAEMDALRARFVANEALDGEGIAWLRRLLREGKVWPLSMPYAPTGGAGAPPEDEDEELRVVFGPWHPFGDDG